MRDNVWKYSPFSVGGTQAVSSGGVPFEYPIWEPGYLGERSYQAICADTDYVYFAAIDDDKLFTRCMSLESGCLVWDIELPFEDIPYNGVVRNDYVLLGLAVHDRKTGELVTDVRTLFGESVLGVEGYSCYAAISKKGFIRQLNEPSAGIYEIDLKERQIEMVSKGLTDIVQDNDNSRLFGFRYDRLVCFDILERKDRWSLGIPQNDDGKPLISCHWPAVADGKVYLSVGGNRLWCVSADKGELVWDRELRHVPKPNTNYRYYRIAVREEHVLLMDSGDSTFVWCHETDHGTEVWRRPVKDGGFTTIAGDVVFLLDDGKYLCALDRFTGELIWKPGARMEAIRAIAGGQYILFVTTYGTAQCYRWEEPYVSPARV